MKKSEFAIKILKQYAKETDTIQRSTSDLSPLEEWLLLELYNAQCLKNKPPASAKDKQNYLSNIRGKKW